MSDAVWYYAAGNEQQGPLSEADVAIAIGRGEITADTLVWREGMQGWAAARTSLPGNLVPQSWADSLPPAIGAGVGGAFGQAAAAMAPSYANGDAGGYFHPTSFVDVVKTVFNRYVQFSGRARRSEYWYWVLFIVAVSIVLSVIDGIIFGFETTDLAIIGPLFSLATFIPSLGVAFRRMHDTGRSAWWLLIALIPLVGTIILIVWFAKRGDEHDNQYGPA
jgi:uncharacterized membrane protein YhaH (DUF805 family)